MAGSMMEAAVYLTYDNTTLCVMPGGASLQYWTNLEGTPNVSPGDDPAGIQLLKSQGTAMNATKITLLNITQREFKLWQASGFTTDEGVDHRIEDGNDPAAAWPPLDPVTNLPIYDDYNALWVLWDWPMEARCFADSDWNADQSWGVYLCYELYGCPYTTDHSMVPLMDTTEAW
ncbi:hypothetical protein AA313_de0209507 [Arthrobotrys entomopaga]|nr:hypothetical protein AA313_de0209507 [Arthrobotrys entomopaga]